MNKQTTLKKRIINKKRYDNNRSKSLCPKCSQKTNHVGSKCDYCYLKEEIYRLKNLVNRVTKIVLKE